MFAIRLRHARKAAGLSLRDLGALVGVSHAAVKKYEDGVAMPSSDVLMRLSDALSVRVEYFFRAKPVVLDGIEYRKRSSLSKKKLDAITHQVIDQIERRIELESLFPRSPVSEFSPVKGLPAVIGSMDDAEDAAETVRKVWQLGLDPIPDLIDVLETNGVRVFMIDEDADKQFDGLAAQVHGMPIVVVSRNWPGDRQRFALAHELGHLMLDHRINENLRQEDVCNRFAAAFLLPKASARREIGQHRNALEVRELGLLKEEFGLSMMCILYRAHELDIISFSCRSDLIRLFRAHGWHVQEPGPSLRSERAHVFEQLLFHALAEDYIGESKAAELMGVSLMQFKRLRAMQNTEELLSAAVGQ